jgi:hypothetical protein
MAKAKELPLMELVGVGEKAGMTVLPATLKERDRLKSLLVTFAPGPRFVELATPAVAEAKVFLKKVESARATVKAPVTALAKAIDAKAKEMTAGLDSEVLRLERSIGEAVAREREERERLEAEAIQKRNALLTEENARVAAINAKLEGDKLTSAQRDTLIEKREAIQEDGVMSRTEAMMVVPTEPILTGGSQVRTSWNVRVTDVKKAYAAWPELFDVTLNQTKWNSFAKLHDNNPPEIPGLVFTKEVKASIR